MVTVCFEIDSDLWACNDLPGLVKAGQTMVAIRNVSKSTLSVMASGLLQDSIASIPYHTSLVCRH